MHIFVYVCMYIFCTCLRVCEVARAHVCALSPRLCQGVSITVVCLCCGRLCQPPPRHCLPLSIAGASVSVTMFLSTYLCCGCLSHPITISRLYRGRLYHPVTVTLSLLRVHLSSRHRLPISIAGPFVNLPLTLSLSRCLYHSNLCHLVIITMCLVPCSCHHTTIDISW